MSTDKEYEFVVTVNEGVDWQEIHTELTRDTTTDASVDSNIVPDRTVDVRKLRSTNPRNTHYNLTIAEANALKNDSRVISVELKRKPTMKLQQDANFNNNFSYSDNESQWGLLRHCNDYDNFYTKRSITDQTYDYVLDGTGVDVVIQDTGIQANHPEWQDANRVSRLKQIDWFSESGVSGSMPSNHYSDSNGHGTHVASTVAGKRFGWAKNADIYVQQLDLGQSDSTGSIDESDAMDSLLGWHNAKTNGRPTVVNMSWGYISIIIDVPVGPHFYDLVLQNYYPITSVYYRGITHVNPTFSHLQNYGAPSQLWFSDYDEDTQMKMNFYSSPYRLSSLDADIQALVNAGIIVCIAAGNDGMKHEVSGGVDYNNSYNMPSYPLDSGRYYYHRGGSPNLNGNPGFNVGAISTERYSPQYNRKTSFSDSGPGVNIYTAGQQIVGAWSDSSGEPYELGSNYYKRKIQGTSMASPQMAGMSACLLQAHPEWSPKQVQDFFHYHATPSIHTTGNTNDYTNDFTLHGGEQRVAYFPMHGKTTHNWKSK